MSDRRLIIGAGTGRCGTMSLAKLLDQQEETAASHELFGPDLPHAFSISPPKRVRWVERLSRRAWGAGATVYADVALQWSFYVEELLHAQIPFSDVRVVYLRRPMPETIESYLHKIERYHHFIRHDGAEWKRSPWDKAFPTYPNERDKLECLERYWRQVYHRAKYEEGRYPGRVRIFETAEALNSEPGQRRLLRWLGFSSPVIDLDVHLNARAETRRG